MLYFGLHWSVAVRVAPKIELTDEQEVELSRLSRSGRTSVRLAQRAGIVLLAAKGLQNKEIALQLGIGFRHDLIEPGGLHHCKTLQSQHGQEQVVSDQGRHRFVGVDGQGAANAWIHHHLPAGSKRGSKESSAICRVAHRR